MDGAERGTRTRARAWPSKSDVLEMVLLVGLLPPAWLLPERGWAVLAGLLGRLWIVVRGDRMRQARGAMAQGLSALGLDVPSKALQRRLVAATFERYFQLLREHAPWGWRPDIRVDGLDRLHDALSLGKGVILYVYPTAFYTIVGKKALAATGVRVVHLSRPGHGLSGTPFGIRYLNPLLTRIEDRYVGQRLVLDESAAGRGLRPLLKALAQNRVTTITANAEGRTHGVAFLGGTLRLARGAASISLSSGATLVPMMVSREAHGRYLVSIEAPLNRRADRRSGPGRKPNPRTLC
ncbi:MAG: hypothetical protein WD673_05580 [Alphaproteobacteria bacterium]